MDKELWNRWILGPEWMSERVMVGENGDNKSEKEIG